MSIPGDKLGSMSFVNVPETVHQGPRTFERLENILASDMSLGTEIQNPLWRSMCHDNIHLLGDSILRITVEAVSRGWVAECPVAKSRGIWRRIDGKCSAIFQGKSVSSFLEIRDARFFCGGVLSLLPRLDCALQTRQPRRDAYASNHRRARGRGSQL